MAILEGVNPQGDPEPLQLATDGSLITSARPVDLQGFIANGGTLSSEFIVNGARSLSLEVSTITSAALTFQTLRAKGGTWRDLYDELGVEVSLPASTGARTFQLPAWSVYGIKVRSGVSGSTVAQAAARELWIYGTQ